MERMPKILAIIPARGGSKSIPRKNLVPLLGKPLIQYTIDAAKNSKLITRIIVSSDNSKIIRYCKKQNIEVPFRRPKNLAGDRTPMLAVVKHTVGYLLQKENYKPEYIVLLQPTSCLRTTRHIDEALSLLIHSNADSVVSVTEIPHNFNPYSVMKLKGRYLKPYQKYDEEKNLRQLKPRFYARNGAAIYAFTYKCLIKKKSMYGNKILPYFMDRKESIDIDDKFDLKICEFILSYDAFCRKR